MWGAPRVHGELLKLGFEISERTVSRLMPKRERIDGVYGHHFIARVEGMGIEQIRISPRSPWQNCYVERLIGSIRRECLNHVIVINAKHLRPILKGYFRYYHEARTHLALDKDTPVSRPIQPKGH